MANIISGDNTKVIKGVGELALRISRFDSYRLFTLYENISERKVLNVSGNQKYYLVFRSPKKEIRIPEYDPKGFFEVDKVNGCILFKITKKNADDILSLKTGGEKIFHIVRVFEERDDLGRVLSVTDEVEVYNGRWGNDADFNTFTLETKVDLLTKALALQIEKNATQFNEYEELIRKYNEESNKSEEYQKLAMEWEDKYNEVYAQLQTYNANTYDGTVLSTDTKYIAYENTTDNIEYTEEQFKETLDKMNNDGNVNVKYAGTYLKSNNNSAK